MKPLLFKMRRAVGILFLGICVMGVLSGFRLEKSMVELTRTKERKGPASGEEKKVRELPVTPSFKMVDSSDGFVGSGALGSKRVTSLQRADLELDKSASVDPADGTSEKGPTSGTDKEYFDDFDLDEWLIDEDVEDEWDSSGDKKN